MHLPAVAKSLLMKGSMMFLSLAGITFAIGLCCFVVNDNQVRETRSRSSKYSSTSSFDLQEVITTVITIVITLTIGALIALLGSWFVYEKWRLHRHSHALSRSLNPHSISLALFSWVFDCIFSASRFANSADELQLPVHNGNVAQTEAQAGLAYAYPNANAPAIHHFGKLTTDVLVGKPHSNNSSQMCPRIVLRKIITTSTDMVNTGYPKHKHFWKLVMQCPKNRT